MEIDKEQYRQEAFYQEEKSNRHTLAGFRYSALTLLVIWALTMVNFFLIDKTLTSIAFVVAGIIMMLPVLISKKMNLTKPWLKYIFLVIVCIAASAVAALLSFHATLVYILPLLFAVQYRQRFVLWITYGVNTICMLASSLFGFYYGLCDLNLLLVSMHTRSWYMEMLEAGSLVLPLNENPIFIIVVFEVLPRSVILLIFAIMLQYTVVRSGEDAVRIAELTWRKETDIATKLYNKNKYEEMVEEYYPKIPQVAVIFWDLNNLKKTNDRFGHAMGDALIETLSNCLFEEVNERCRAYRVGGDEFLILLDNPKDGEPEQIIENVKRSIRKCHDEGGLKVSCATGCSVGEGKSVRQIVAAADSNMYADKMEYKKREGML